jgi:cell shape-determining protein MreD
MTELLLIGLVWLMTPALPVSMALVVTAAAVNRLPTHRFLLIALVAGLIESIWLVQPIGIYSLALVLLALLIAAIQWRFAARPLWLVTLLAMAGESVRQYVFTDAIRMSLVLLTGGLVIVLLVVLKQRFPDQAVYLRRPL